MPSSIYFLACSFCKSEQLAKHAKFLNWSGSSGMAACVDDEELFQRQGLYPCCSLPDPGVWALPWCLCALESPLFGWVLAGLHPMVHSEAPSVRVLCPAFPPPSAGHNRAQCAGLWRDAGMTVGQSVSLMFRTCHKVHQPGVSGRLSMIM